MTGEKGQLTFIEIKKSRGNEVLFEIHLDTFDKVLYSMNHDLL
jgi:hypothetical protein